MVKYGDDHARPVLAGTGPVRAHTGPYQALYHLPNQHRARTSCYGPRTSRYGGWASGGWGRGGAVLTGTSWYRSVLALYQLVQNDTDPYQLVLGDTGPLRTHRMNITPIYGLLRDPYQPVNHTGPVPARTSPYGGTTGPVNALTGWNQPGAKDGVHQGQRPTPKTRRMVFLGVPGCKCTPPS